MQRIASFSAKLFLRIIRKSSFLFPLLKTSKINNKNEYNNTRL